MSDNADEERTYTVVARADGYELLTDNQTHHSAIRCRRCTLVSYNRTDIELRYCGFCHKFHHAKETPQC